MLETKTVVKKGSTLPALVVGLGTVGVAAGLLLFLKKPPGVSAGDTVRAHFKFDHLGDGGDFILLVRFGWYKPWYLPFGFDPEEGLDSYTKAVTLEGPGTYEFDIDCVIPDGAKASTYDAEGSILSPGMEPGQDWLTRFFTKKAITVRKS